MSTTLDRRHLDAFVAVADRLHFGRAAEHLHLSQPALSRLVRALELELGVTLLDRTTRRVVLTEPGRVFRQHAMSALHGLDAAGEAARRAAAGHLGQVRVGFTGPSTYETLPRIARAFREHHPDVEVTLLGPLFTYEQTAALLERRLDVGLVHAAVTHPELVFRVVASEELVVALPDDHRLARLDRVPLEQLADEAFVTYPADRGSAIREAGLAACADAGFAPRIVQESADSHALVALVAAGAGVAVVSSSMTNVRPPGSTYRPILGPRREVPLGFVWRAGDDSPVLARLLALVDVAG